LRLRGAPSAAQDCEAWRQHYLYSYECFDEVALVEFHVPRKHCGVPTRCGATWTSSGLERAFPVVVPVERPGHLVDKLQLYQSKFWEHS